MSTKETGAGGFLDVSDCEHSGILRVRPPRPEKLSEPDSVAAMARQEPGYQKPLEEQVSDKWPAVVTNRSGKKHKLAIMGISEELLERSDPRYREMLRLANSFRRHRAREMMIAHGYVSAGVNAILSNSALSLAASRYIYEKAIETGEISFFTMYSKLATDSRQNELSAWELCAREAMARKKAAATMGGVPWLTQGPPKRGKVGRPRKVDVVARETEEMFRYVDGDSKEGPSSAAEPTGTEDNGT